MSTAVRYQVMPPLSTDEYQELYESIKSEGVLEPIHVDEEGVVIDGHHRSKIASELGVPCPVITHDDLSESKKRSLAFTLNLKRRHLNREQRRALGLESLRLDPIASNREHSKRTGLSDKTIQSIREDENIPEPKDVIQGYKEEHPEKSNRQVAKDLGVDKNTVNKLVTENSEFPNFQSGKELKNEAPHPSTPIISPQHLDELNQPQEEAMPTTIKPKGDKTSNYLTEAAERINLMLETLASMNFTETTPEAKATALEQLEAATRALTSIKKQIK